MGPMEQPNNSPLEISPTLGVQCQNSFYSVIQLFSLTARQGYYYRKGLTEPSNWKSGKSQKLVGVGVVLLIFREIALLWR